MSGLIGLLADPSLTPKGEGQAEEAHAAWQKELQFGLPLPEKLYCSPLTRAIRTHQRTFDGLLPEGRKTVIVEVTNLNSRSVR